MKLLKQAEYMAATGFTLHPTIAFRSGLGPYKAQAEMFDETILDRLRAM